MQNILALLLLEGWNTELTGQRGRYGRKKEGIMLQHILVGLDGSPLAETILAYVSILAKALGAEVTLLHAVHLSEDMQRDEPSRLLQPAIQHAETQAQDYLSRVAQRLSSSGLKVRSQVTVGDAVTAIVRTAQQ
jgi:nucleotide-binding universal stress UspA family protein